MTRRLFNIAAMLLPWMRPSNYSETPNSSPWQAEITDFDFAG